MEDGEKTKLEEMLMCPVCQDIFKDPRQLPCGHSMCMGCLENMIDHSSDAPFRCPDCRAHFGPVFGVQKSYTLSSIVEDFRVIRRRMEVQRKIVYCDCCPEKATPAFKTCLKCEVSLCRKHIKDHQELPVFTGHPLVEPLGDLQERKCPQHNDQVLKYYCNTSGRYVCNMCSLQSKQNHQTTESYAVLRRQLTEDIDERFNMLKEQIGESSGAIKTLQEDLRREKVNSSYSSLNTVTAVLLCLWFIVLYYAYNYAVENQALKEALDKQHSHAHHIYSTIAEHLLDHPKKSQTSPDTEDQGLLKLDVDTASPFLGVSADLQTAERVKTKLDYPSSSRRFEEAPQVLSARCVSSGRHGWEVEAEGYWDVSVSYTSILRKSKHGSTFGNNQESWSLTHNGKGSLFAYHNKRKTLVSGTLMSRRVAVMVDFKGGKISFSAVESTTTLLHEFKVDLTQPVCLGLGLYRVDPPSTASIVRAW
ncbi:E3 ubiquitin/ISG15 ligase TRIM25-like isoform X2 [Centropristis striata]|uniref:E3 ubiquitin/ISG15 ligase TRIM25-like isoform X2 n=1 Tax=Centropristis striata TaxID=184440 RepID=UPI0027E1829C|nr:E3 ubiquitin/ISG15 ligase TRIM25-like isoform X2 [Centropristis striata]